MIHHWRIGRGARRGLVVGVVALAAALFPGGGTQAQTMQVTGEGVVSATPDSAELRLSVLTVAPDAAAAMGALSGRLEAVLIALQAGGIPAADMQTTDLSLQPVYAPRTSGRDDLAPPRIDGYRARTGLVVQVAPVERVGAVVDMALSAGANGFDGVRFTLSDPAPLRRLARTRAVEDAFDKARTYAEAAVVALGPVQDIREGGAPQSPFPVAEMRMAADSLTLAPGTLDIRETVSVRFAIAPADP